MMAAQPLPSCDNPMFLDNANYPHGWGVVVVNPPPMLRATATGMRTILQVTVLLFSSDRDHHNGTG